MTEIITNEVNMIDTECECDLIIAIIFCRYLENQRPVHGKKLSSIKKSTTVHISFILILSLKYFDKICQSNVTKLFFLFFLFFFCLRKSRIILVWLKWLMIYYIINNGNEESFIFYLYSQEIWLNILVKVFLIEIYFQVRYIITNIKL